MIWLLLAGLLAIRCLRLLKLHSKQDEAKAAPACVLSSASGQLLPPPASPYQQTWPDVAAMCMVEDGSQLAQPDAKKVQADLVVHLLRTGVASQRSAPIIGDLLQRFPANNFSITDDLVVSQAAGVYPLGALLNHSCLPNCIVTYDESTHVQEVRTACAVTAGTELTHSFVNLALSTHDRQEHLKAVYGFNCKCPRCIASCVLTPGAAVTVPNTAVPTRPQAAELAALAFSAGPALTQGNKASISEHTTPEQLQSLRAVDDALHAAATCKTEAAERELLLAALDAACSQLHPLHSKLGELHSALQHVCMVMGDMGAAAQHAAFLACQLRHTLSACGGGAAAPAETGKHAAAAPGAHTPATDGFVSAPDAVLAVCAGQLPPHPLMALQVGTVVELLHAAQPAEDSVQWEFAVPSGGEWMHRCLPTRVRELFDANAALLRVVYGWQLLRRPSAA